MRRVALLWLIGACACLPSRPTPKQLGAESDAAACERDEAAACVALGEAYRADAERVGASDRSLTARLELADVHFRKACALGEPAGCERLLDSGDAESVRYGLEQLCRRHARAESCLTLAEAYSSGSAPVEGEDPAKARELLELACAAGELERGCARLATAFEEGSGGEKDLARAFALHERVCRAAENAARSCVQAGRALLNGTGTEKAARRALIPLRRACERWGACDWLATASGELCRTGDAALCRELATLYREGLGVERDEARALRLAQKACSDGDIPACRLAEAWSPR